MTESPMLPRAGGPLPHTHHAHASFSLCAILGVDLLVLIILAWHRCTRSMVRGGGDGDGSETRDRVVATGHWLL